MRKLLPALVSTLLLLAGCIPESKHPLPAGVSDDRLLGRWMSAEEGEEGYADIAAAGVGRYHVTMVSYDEGGQDDNPDVTEMDILTARIAGQWYLTAIGLDEPEEGGPDAVIHLILKYEISGDDVLMMWPMDSQAVADDVRAGLIAGEVKPGEYWEDVTLTADSESLAAWIAASDPERIFVGDPLPMRRP